MTDALGKKLGQLQEITISVTGRKSGRKISNPVWFVLEGERLYLLPVKGSETQWYRNVLAGSSLRVEARGAEGEFKAVPITERAQVAAVVEKFREKYGSGDVKKYYSGFDVAVVVE